MFRLNRNERSRWSGNGVHVEPESVFMIGRNMQLLGFVASGNGRSFWGWFILGLIIDPILAGLLYWLITKDN